MKVPLGWLREYAPVDPDPEKVEGWLTMAGFPVDERTAVDGDVVFAVDVPSNRPDALSVLGLAREVAAMAGVAFRMPEPRIREAGPAAGELIKVIVDAPDLCPRYVARAVMGVRVGPSPETMQRRLRAMGLRPVNNIVDITNYVMFECGQPLHAFDYDRLGEKTIVVRRSRDGERIRAIDDRVYELPPGTLVIADARNPVAIAGIMGGKESEISSATRHVVIESALFDPLQIRRTSRVLGLSTESSFRFERQADHATVEWASRRAAQLMGEIARGAVAPGSVDADFVEPEHRTIELRLAQIGRLLGVQVSRERVIRDLDRLGFKVTGTGGTVLSVGVPYWRKDVRVEADLIEEIARMEGYEQISGDTALPIRLSRRDRQREVRERVHRLLSAAGYREVLSWSFLERKECDDFGYWTADEPVTVRSPDGKVAKVLRRSVVPALLRIMATNDAYRERRSAIYEIAKQYMRLKEGYDERLCLAAVDPRGFRHAKGALEGVLRSLKIPYRFVQRDLPTLVPGRAVEVMIEEKRRGFLGEVSAAALKLRGIPGEGVAAFEVDFGEIRRRAVLEPGKIEPPARLLPVRRDVAVIVDEALPWADVEAIAREAFPGGKGAVLKGIELFDVFTGSGIPEGKKSVAFSLVAMPTEGALDAARIEELVAPVVSALEERLGARLRGKA